MSFSEYTDFRDYLERIARINHIQDLLTEERMHLFYRLTEHMLTVNQSFNLTAITDWRRVILLHYADCMMSAACFPEGASVIDVGCGAGFPTLPLAICRPDLRITALDSTAKRVHYVADTATLLGLSNITPLVSRAEDAARSPLRASFDCATARAVAALPILSEICLPFVKVGGLFAAMKGKSAAEEISAAKHAISTLGGKLLQTRDTPLIDENGESYSHTTILIQSERLCASAYPRAYAKILKKPL